MQKQKNKFNLEGGSEMGKTMESIICKNTTAITSNGELKPGGIKTM